LIGREEASGAVLVAVVLDKEGQKVNIK